MLVADELRVAQLVAVALALKYSASAYKRARRPSEAEADALQRLASHVEHVDEDAKRSSAAPERALASDVALRRRSSRSPGELRTAMAG